MRCEHESAGKEKGSGGKKIGNAHLKWAFSEAACLMMRSCAGEGLAATPREEGRQTQGAVACWKRSSAGRSITCGASKRPFDVKRFLNR